MKHTLTCTAHNLTLRGGLNIYAVFVTFMWIMKMSCNFIWRTENSFRDN